VVRTADGISIRLLIVPLWLQCPHVPEPCRSLLVGFTTTTRRSTMKRTALVLGTIAALGAASMTQPAEARGGRGAAIGFGLAAGALMAGAAANAYAYDRGPGYYGYGGPVYHGPRYGYYDRPAYGYYGGPRYYRQTYYGY
jgi:hypothetical protein